MFSKRSLSSGEKDAILSSRSVAPVAGTVVTHTLCALGVASLIAEAPLTIGISLTGITPKIVLCAASMVAMRAAGSARKPSRPAQIAPAGQPAPKRPKIGSSTKVKVQIGQWLILSYVAGVPKAQCDCSLTYTCKYGLGWDEVCDN